MPLTGTLKTLLIRGLLAGLIAGLLAGSVAFFIGEPHVDAAIAIEEANSAAEPHDDSGAVAGHSHGDEATEGHSHGDDALVSRDGQKGGLFLATALAGLALGAIFAATAHYARRVVDLPGPVLAVTLATAGWLAIEAVPFFKYPANPPAVGDPETINKRTLLWLAAVILGLAAIAAAAYVSKIVATQQFSVRLAAPVASFLVIVVLGYVLLPGVNEVGPDFPATLLWEFRLSSLATQATLWIGLGLAFAVLTDLATRQRSDAEKLSATR
ncbi:CbtA family protein [Antrihabitans sp. YC3-6]|uniref:CbtA family protein n=1 Tax=Antrihabitans stalagmiti TaxID=2799499 RepID=A0A934NS04_9NOCA|nr:CbtA family protein [Antrihabitans stalagmiti]MBJ8340234.1 CbtA family protein [Antrihabitans stalagmiti]